MRGPLMFSLAPTRNRRSDQVEWGSRQQISWPILRHSSARSECTRAFPVTRDQTSNPSSVCNPWSHRDSVEFLHMYQGSAA